MEAFWPDAAPCAARNRLNVALHGLRRTLAAAGAPPLIMCSGGGYRLHPQAGVWVDTEVFDNRLCQARRLEAAGASDRAVAAFEDAVATYRGEFLAEAPDEEWAAAPRERLRLAHLDALTRLGRLHHDRGHYGAAIARCQEVVARDPCREDIHRQLMRCYAAQGQAPLAVLAYRDCVRALTEQLGIAPAPGHHCAARPHPAPSANLRPRCPPGQTPGVGHASMLAGLRLRGPEPPLPPLRCASEPGRENVSLLAPLGRGGSQ